MDRPVADLTYEQMCQIIGHKEADLVRRDTRIRDLTEQVESLRAQLAEAKGKLKVYDDARSAQVPVKAEREELIKKH